MNFAQRGGAAGRSRPGAAGAPGVYAAGKRPSLPPSFFSGPMAGAGRVRRSLSSGTIARIQAFREAQQSAAGPISPPTPQGESAAAAAESAPWQVRMYNLFEDPASSRSAMVLSLFIIGVIVLSCITFIMESMPEYNPPKMMVKPPFFDTIEFISVMIFTTEFLARVLTVSWVPDYVKFPDREATGFDNFKAFWHSPMNIIDFIAVLPLWVELILATSYGQLGFLRVLRLSRVFRIFKLGKYNRGLQLIGRVMAESTHALGMLIFLLMIGMVLFGSALYFAEGGVYDPVSGKYMRPNAAGDALEETPFTSIPASFWCIMVTVTTVGYGDMVPTTPWGKLVISCCMMGGIIVLALPITIIGTNFSAIYDEQAMEEAIENADWDAEEMKELEEGRTHDSFESLLSNLNDVGQAAALPADSEHGSVSNNHPDTFKMANDFKRLSVLMTQTMDKLNKFAVNEVMKKRSSEKRLSFGSAPAGAGPASVEPKPATEVQL